MTTLVAQKPLDAGADGAVRRMWWVVGPTLLLALVALAGLAFGANWSTGPSAVVAPHPARSRPAESPPPVEPLVLKEVPAATAYAINAATPFSDLPNPAARPFRSALAGPMLDRASDCLAAAAYYEAGDDAEGERSVVQVVLNRVRHPAFPKSVCGVVFQGSERVTGCQFTFTCDGALSRTPSPQAWERARNVAEQALSGYVYVKVGNATHYHTNWVVPYWSASMIKLTAVETHLFFRWAGGWGTPSALKGSYAGVEPVVARIASLSPAHASTAGEDGMFLATLREGMATKQSASLVPPQSRILFQSANEIVILLNKAASPDSFADAARGLCGALAFCKVRGWTDPASAPSQLPVAATSLGSMSFSYLRNSEQRFEKALWNCSQFARPNKRECMKIPFAQLAKSAKREVVRSADADPLTATGLPEVAATAAFE